MRASAGPRLEESAGRGDLVGAAGGGDSGVSKNTEQHLQMDYVGILEDFKNTRTMSHGTPPHPPPPPEGGATRRSQQVGPNEVDERRRWNHDPPTTTGREPVQPPLTQGCVLVHISVCISVY